MESRTPTESSISRRHILRATIAAGAAAMRMNGSPQSRAQSIKEAISRLETECKRLGGGDWYQWHKSSRPFRDALWLRVKAAYDNPMVRPDKPDEKGSLVKLLGGKPGRYYDANQVLSVCAGHSGASDNLDQFIAGNPAIPNIVVVSQWLREHGIDVLFVPAPVPPLIEPEGLVEDGSLVPGHGVVAPYQRRELLELLRKDVEVVDPLPAILNAHKQRTPGLIITTDTHWGPLAHRLAAEEVAMRLRRCDWVRNALKRPAGFVTRIEPCDFPASLMVYLPPQLRDEVEPLRKGDVTLVTTVAGEPVEPVQGSPIMVTGDSFTNFGMPYAATLSAHLSRGLNVSVSLLRFDGNTVQSFREMARDPELLKGVKAVVWVANTGSCSTPFTSGWPKELHLPAHRRQA